MAPLLLHVFPTFAVGGAQVRFASIANRFGRRWRHAIVALDGVTDCAARLSPELDVSFPAFAARKGDLSGTLRAIRRLLRAQRPDVLVTSNWGAIEWAIANLLPMARHIHTEDGFGPEERTRQLPRRVLTRRLVLRRSTVVLPSRVLLDIATRQWRLPPGRLHYIPNGVDLARFATPPRPVTAAPPVIGIVAALRPEKNVGRLLRALRLLDQPARLVIVGDGAERSMLQAQADQLGLGEQVSFAGAIADTAPCYAEFDIFALSSDTEQMPLSVLEAMAASLPVAATDVGDVRGMVAAENAAYVAPLTDAGLAAALRPLLADARLRQQVGAANRLRAGQVFEQEVMFQAYAALFDDSFSGS